MKEAKQWIEVYSIKGVVIGSMDDPKENEVCMLIFNIEKSFHMLAGNMDQISILRA